MKKAQVKATKLEDYVSPAFLVDHVDLTFFLKPEATKVHSKLKIRQNSDCKQSLFLDGDALRLDTVVIDGRVLGQDEYECGEFSLSIPDFPSEAILEIVTFIDPVHNTKLEGLYLSSGNFCTQCEAEGFRRITYYPDRPDVMATYTVTVHADQDSYPVLLSNGNLIDQGVEEDGSHWAKWDDPFPKPSYLFALVAGDLACCEDSFKTRSGQDVTLKIFVEHGNEDKCAYAMDSLIRSMKWDEERFGLEYDLDIFNIVAVSDFNMGAMENKSLNIFNSKCILASPDTATDFEFERIEAIVAHEYFHNWTGNRVTCRDWFQLSLKEGLTVYRDQEFSADMRSAPVKRIQDVRTLRARQFPEDAGPLSHPIRPESYIEINNFYTSTVYEKGGEVIRMMAELLGKDGFRKGLDLYFERHDNQAVTCDDFVAAMEDANGANLKHFRLWYSQAGTPEVEANWSYDAQEKTFTLTLDQFTAPTPGQDVKQPLLIPFTVGLIGQNGAALPLKLEGENGDKQTTKRTLQFDQDHQIFTFVDVNELPVPSLNRNFSAPIKLSTKYTTGDLAFLMGHDKDAFSRWDAAQTYASRLMLKMVKSVQEGGVAEFDSQYADILAINIADKSLDPAFLAQMLGLPSIDYVTEQMEVADFAAVEKVRSVFKAGIAKALYGQFKELYLAGKEAAAYSPDSDSAGRRALCNTALGYLSVIENDPACLKLVVDQFEAADNMTDRMAALSLLADIPGEEREKALKAFESRYADNTLVMDKWFAVQATSTISNALEEVKKLLTHSAFSYKNPNKVRALIGAFSGANPARFHAEGGEGYRFLADSIIHLNGINPQVASKILAPLGSWRRMNATHQKMMKAELQRILDTEDLSNDVYEIASKSLV
ncbi:aminopeptidase N [Kiloniella spongiae]|uniref:Aminopeptidase N n=1 Tax=Kiloniella spongiae TaxID=1489064 RepID=A0A0H2MHJ3_9PROT|nr:aminopeptidase N [Kiloniella spongiae]KLN62039.1 aminopeptidase N [Kiloniella spongiae]